MANFGFKDLVLVEPYAPVWKETRAAVGAGEVIHSAKEAKTLAEALRDRTLVIGTTTGRRRNLDRDLISMRELPAWLAGRNGRYRAALLFGSEKTGLSNEALSYCHALVRIPTTVHSPSMNLGQAVAVCCYELARSAKAAQTGSPARRRPSDPTTLQSLDHLFDRLVRILDVSSYFTPKSREAQLLKLRRFMLDLNLSNHDARILGGALAQTEWRLNSTKSGK